MIDQIEISIQKQQLIAIQNKSPLLSFSVSTSLSGVGNQQGSNQTPLGKHKVRAKIGEGLPVDAVLVGRRFTDEIYSAELARAYPQRDWILTRILWLSGCELGLNRLGAIDSMSRYIYIHGTPDSEPMGVPASHGCIRMRNQDILQLFPLVPAYCSVNILR